MERTSVQSTLYRVLCREDSVERGPLWRALKLYAYPYYLLAYKDSNVHSTPRPYQ